MNPIRSRTVEGFGGEEKGGGVRSRPGGASSRTARARALRLGPSYFFISFKLVLGPLNSLFFFSRGLGWRMHLVVEVTELSTNKQHHLSREPYPCVCVCFITAGPITKLFAWAGEESGGHVPRETTSRGLCG